LRARLRHALKPGTVGFVGRARDCVDDGVHLVPLWHRIERGERHAHLDPEGAQDQFAPSGRANRGEEVGVFPRVDRRSVDRWVVLE